MNESTCNRPTASPDQITALPPASLPMLPIELLDACGNGYTAADLACVLATWRTELVVL
jgi:hypothetical protein